MRMARVAVLTMFAFNGVLIGSWTARVPADHHADARRTRLSWASPCWAAASA